MDPPPAPIGMLDVALNALHVLQRGAKEEVDWWLEQEMSPGLGRARSAAFEDGVEGEGEGDSLPTGLELRDVSRNATAILPGVQPDSRDVTTRQLERNGRGASDPSESKQDRVARVAATQRALAERSAQRSAERKRLRKLGIGPEVDAERRRERQALKTELAERAQATEAVIRSRRRVREIRERQVKHEREEATRAADISKLKRLRITHNIMESAARQQGLSSDKFVEAQRQLALLPPQARHEYQAAWMEQWEELTSRPVYRPPPGPNELRKSSAKLQQSVRTRLRDFGASEREGQEDPEALSNSEEMDQSSEYESGSVLSDEESGSLLSGDSLLRSIEDA